MKKVETFIHNEHLLNALSADALHTLRARAEQHMRHASIEFKILECTDTTLVVRVVQERSHAGNYFDQKRLVEIVRETFADLGPWTTIRARPIPYTPSPTDVVTPEWISAQMKQRGLKTVDVARALGMDAASVSALKNGVRPLSGVAKAAFYYYLNNELKMERGFPTHTQDINGQTIKLGDIVGYDFDDDSTVFEVVFEENAFRKLYKKWDKLLPKPLLEYGDHALKMRLKIIG